MNKSVTSYKNPWNTSQQDNKPKHLLKQIQEAQQTEKKCVLSTSDSNFYDKFQNPFEQTTAQSIQNVVKLPKTEQQVTHSKFNTSAPVFVPKEENDGFVTVVSPKTLKDEKKRNQSSQKLFDAMKRKPEHCVEQKPRPSEYNPVFRQAKPSSKPAKTYTKSTPQLSQKKKSVPKVQAHQVPHVKHLPKSHPYSQLCKV